MRMIGLEKVDEGLLRPSSAMEKYTLVGSYRALPQE